MRKKIQYAHLYFLTGLEKYSHFVDSMWKDIAAAQAACASIDNTEIVKFLDVLENCDGILVSGMGKCMIWAYWVTCSR